MKQPELNITVTVTEPVKSERKLETKKPPRFILGKTPYQTYLDI